MESGKASRMLMSILAVLAVGIITYTVVLQSGTGKVTQFYVNVYTTLGVVSAVFLGIIFLLDFASRNSDNLLAKSVYIFEKSALRPLSFNVAIPIIVALVATFAVITLVASANAALIYVPNPGSGTLSWGNETLSQVKENALLTQYNAAVVPGVLEESAIFVASQLTTFFLMFALVLWLGDWILESPTMYWATSIPSILIWSGIFSLAHGRYGGNETAYVTAFVFEVIVQFLNQLTGSFISWLPHIAHNATVVLTSAFSLVV